MKKIHMIAALLAMLLPTMSAWGGSTYYYKMHLKVSSNSTGRGLVYAQSDTTELPSGATFVTETTVTHSRYDNKNVNTGAAFAKANYGYVFTGWSSQDNSTTYVSTANPYTPVVNSSATSASKASTTSYYAVFDTNPDSYTLTLNKPEGLASYTVTAPSGFTADLSHGGSATVYKGDQYTFKYNLSSDEYDFINWTVNGEVKETASVSVTISADTTVTLTLKKKVTYYATCQGSVGGTYKANSTTVSGSDQTISNFGSVTVSLSNPVANSGYTFYGWYILHPNGVKEYISYYTSVSTGEKKENITIGAEFREVQDCTVNFVAPAEGKITYAISGGNSGEVDDVDRSETVPAGADVTLTATCDYESRRAKWYTKNDSGEKVYFSIDNPVTKTFASSATLGVDFVPVNEKIVNAIEAAQSSSTHEAILAADAEIVLGTSIEIPSGITIDLDGHTLYVDGTLTVNGSLVNGTVSKCLKVIKQTGADGLQPLNPYGNAKYWKTEKAVASTTSITGWSGSLSTHLTVMRGDGVAVRGAITSNTKFVECTFDGNVAVNHVTAIGTASDNTSVAENKSYILLADVTMTGPIDTSNNRLRSTAKIDCAGNKCSETYKETHSSHHPVLLNASKIDFSPSSYWQNSAATFYNCPSITITGLKNTPVIHLYDSGKSLTFSQYDSTGYMTCHFYSGLFDCNLANAASLYINSSSDKQAWIYGGGFLNKPDKKWITTSKASTHAFCQHSDGYWYLDVNQDPNVAQIGSTKYLTLEEALVYLNENASATLTLLRDASLDSPYTLAAGKSLVVELDGCHIGAPNGFIKNYGNLSIRDKNNRLAASGVTVGSGKNVVENYDNGTLDICYGLYEGNFVVNGGTFTTHHGKFIGSVVNNGGEMNLKGGIFSSDVSALLDEGYHAFSYGGWHYVGRFPKPEEGSSSIGDFARVLTAMPTADKTLYLAKKTYSLESCSSVDEWKRVAELKAAYVLYDDEFNFDILVGFDRDIAANTVQATVDSKFGPQSDYFPAMNAGVLERIFSPRITQNPISYKRFIYDNGEGNYDTMEAGVSAVNNANAGTACVLAMDLWKFHDKTKTTKDSYLTILALPYVFGAGNDVAMIRPATGEATFKSTLQGAIDVVKNNGGGTVMLANNCNEIPNFDTAGTYIVDSMGFEHGFSDAEGGYAVAEGLSVTTEIVDSSVATLKIDGKAVLPGAVAIKYVVVAGSAATAVDAPTAVSGLIYDGTQKTGVAAGTGYTLSGNTATAAGSYTATATLEDGYVWSDDSSDAKEISWSIGKATLTATAENKSVIRGETVPYTIAYSGFVNGEDDSALTSAPIASCDYNAADMSATATSYPITLSGGAASNYDLTLVSGTLTVNQCVAIIEQGGETGHYTSLSAAVEATSGNTITVTVTANDTETVTLPQGKTLVVTVNDGVEANVTVNPTEGEFVEAETSGATTTYVSKKITVEMEEPPAQATVEVVKVDHGVTNAVSDASLVNEAVHALIGNHDVSRTDNTDKLDVLDKITVTPTKIVEDVTSGTMIIRSATFDVVPHLKAGQSLAEGQKLKFRLPVDASATQLAAVVYHGDAQFGIYPVQTYNDEKYVEVESDAFSPYGYDLLDGETANPIAAIGTTGYASLSAAVAAVPTDGTETTITMLAGETIAADAGITIAAGKNIVLDLNGQTVQMAAASADERWLIKNEGALTVKDSAENGKLLMSATGQASTAVHKCVIKNMGALTVESGTIELTYSGTNKEEPTAIMNDASDRATSLTVKGGTVVNGANRGTGVYLAVNDTNATVFDVQGGRVEGFGAAVRYYFDDRNLTDAKLTFNISGGTVHGRGMYGVQGMSTSSKDWNSISFDISGGTISCAGLLNRKSVISPLQGTVSISGGTFAGDVYIYGHALEITDGDFAGSVTLHRTKESLESASISGGQFSSGLTIAETTADNTTNPYYNAKFITGGIYGTAPEARNVVDEYAVVDNTDSDTQGDYPKTIGGAVASVTAEGNTTYYATLSDAITAANASDVTEITILDSSITTSPDADWKVVGNKLVKKSYVAQIGDVKYETFAEAIEAAEEYKTANGDYPVITVLDATAEQANPDWKIADGKLVHKLYVAQIGSTKYESLAEAVAAASAGDTVELIVDDRVSLTNGGELVIDKSLTITGPVDGDGKPLYTIYGTEDATGTNRILVDGSGTVTLSNLNIAGFGNDYATDASHAPVYVASTFTGTVNLSNLNISDFNRGGVFLYGGTFNVTDCTIDCANSRSGAFTKGIEIRNNAAGTIEDTTIVNMTSESDESVACGIEFYGNGAVTVSGCTIEGDSWGAVGIGTAGFTDTTTTGTITVEDCDITVYYAALYASALGDGLGENGTTIKVTSGDYTADNFAASALFGTIAIEGGTFTGLLYEGDAESGESGSLSISGGLFDDDVLEEYCADSYIPTVDEDTGLNTVKHGTYVAAIYDDNDDLFGKYETLGAAFADASEGDTVLLLTDVTEALAYGENISVTLNLNGNTISVSSGYAISVTAGELTVTSVVDDDGYATGGIVGAISVSDGASLKLTGGIYDVDWDECDIEGSIAVSSINRFYDWDPTEVEAASAVFTSPVPYEYCATGFIPGAYDDIYIDDEYYYYVKEGTFLWKITDADGKVAYSETVPDAEEDEEWWEYDWFGEHEMNRNGFTMTLLHDVSADDDNFSAYVSGLTYTVDLGGHTVNQQMGFGVGECDVTIVNGTVSNAGGTAISIANGAQVTLGNGLVIAQSTTGVYVEGGTEDGAYSKLTVKNGAAINGTCGVLVFGSGSSNPVTEVVVEGGTITGTKYGISGNGTIEGDTDYSNTKITISGGTVSGGEVGIYHPQAGALSVSGGTISGEMAIYARSGTIAVTGGSLNATGTGGEYNVSYAGNELQATGDALVLDAVDYPGGNPTASISGGTFVSVNGDGVASYAATGQSAESGFVSGGTFSSEVPEEYCADGFIPTGADPDTGLYTVRAAAYVAQIVRGGEVIAKYETLADAIDAAQNGDTVELLANIANFTGTQTIDKSLTLDGAGHSITAAAVPADGHRNMVDAFTGGTSMLKVEGEVTLRNITLDGDATHRYTYLVSADNSSAKLTTSNVRLLNGGELAGDANGAIVEQGAGYGAGIHLNNGAQLVVSNGFYACTGGPDGGVFPFTGILPEGGASVSFELTENPNDPTNVDIGSDLLLVGMVGVIPLDQVQDVLDYMKVPSRFIPYTLTLGDGSAYAFTGASPRTWNDIIDYGKEIMDVSTAIGYEGLDKVSTPVEVGLLTDTVLPDTFRFADTNFTVNGNGNALSGTIEYTDNAGLIEDIVLGTEDNPLVLDLTDVTQPIEIGSGISVSNVTIQMTAEQATAGTPVIIWDAAHGVDAPENEAGVSVVLVNDQGQPTSDMAELIWDDEMGMAYIGPCEARLTGPTHETPIYTTLANAIAWAEQTGDTVTLMTNIVNFTGTQTITKQDLVIDGAGYSITAAPVSTHRDVVNAWAGSTAMFKLETGDVTFRNITLDGDATHAYTFLISADNSSITLTTENVRLLNGGELCGDANGAIVEQGAGYGAAVHLNNGAHMVVSNGFYACTGGKTAGCFPFTGILVDTNGGDVKFELTGNPNDPENVDIGGDLLLVGMPGVIPLDQTQDMLDYMKVPTRFIPYTLTLGDGSAYAFTGASPLGWNDIINYGKEIMDVSTAIGYQGLDKISTPVEVGLLTDTVLPDTFRFADTNFTVNGNGNALAGTIEYTDNAGLIHDIVLGTEGNALVLDMTETTKPIVLGSGISVTNVTIEMTAEQATAGTPVIIWDAAHGVDAPANEAGVTVQIVDDHGDSTGVTKELIWDDEMGLAYIGPVEARLTGPTHDKPIYTTLADAIARAEQSGDTVTLMTNIVDFTGSQMIVKTDLVLDGAGHTITAAPVTDYPDFFAAYGGEPMLKLGSGAITLKNITLDGGATHAYTYLVSADNDSVSLTTENITLLHGGAQSLDTDGNPTPGVGYGAAIHLNNGAELTVKDGFYADTHGAPAEAGQTIAKADGIFPFTAILPEGGSAVSFDLTEDTDANPTVSIGEDLLLVGMLGAIPHDQMQDILDYMKVPKRFIPYTLTIADGASYAFTGGSPRRWNDIIDYGKEIMDAATATGFTGLDKDTTPVEVGLLVDTILPAGADGDGYDFLYEDSNFSINGNGNALSGTIKFTDDADGGLMEDITLGTDTNPLTLDLSETDNPVDLGDGVIIQDVVVLMTEDQATLGKVVFDWDVNDEEPPDDEQGVTVTVVDSSGNPTGEEKGVVWDEEYGVAYIGPVEARLTGETHEIPVYTSLANALEIAKDNDKVELLTNAVLSAVQGVGSDVTLDLEGYKVEVSGGQGLLVTNATLNIVDSGVSSTGMVYAADGAAPTSLIESGNGGVVNIPTGIYVAASGQNVLVATGTGAFAVSGGYFSNPVLLEHCAESYTPVDAEAGAPQPYTVAEFVSGFVYPIEGSVGVPVTNTWLATYLSDIYSDPTKPVLASITNDLVQALSENGANEMPRWESYVLGLDPTDVTARLRLTATAKDAATVTITGVIDMTKFPKPEGTTITFRLAEVNPDGTKKEDLVTDSDEPSFDVLLEEVVGKELAIFADIAVEGVAK